MIETFLEQVVLLQQQVQRGHPIYHYSGIHDFVLQHGKPMERIDFPIRLRTPKQCFMNAAHLTLDKRYTRLKFLYCEGFALGVIPVQHAWNLVFVEGKWRVVDPTWERGVEYFGIAFKTDYLCRALRQQGHYGLIDAWRDKWPLLRIPPEKAAQWKHSVMDKL